MLKMKELQILTFFFVENRKSDCKHSNYCIRRMYTLEMKCHHCVDSLPQKLQREIDKAEKNREMRGRANSLM